MSNLLPRYLKALKKLPTDRTPIWIMRQAGRYLPEYRAVREKAGSFLALCKNPELACEVTLQPIRRFDLDAAILFSDILTIPDAMELGLNFIENEGPVFKNPLQTEIEIKKLVSSVDIPALLEKLKYVPITIRNIKSELPTSIPLIGFAGSPWTLACYMIEGKGSKNFYKAKKMLYTEPGLLSLLLNKISECTEHYLRSQINAGVDSLMLFDTWGGLLTQEAYEKFSLNHMKKIISNIKKDYPDTPITLFTKGGGQWLNAQAQSGADCLGLDWTIEIKNAREIVQSYPIALQGNLDPAVLYGTDQEIHQQVSRILSQFGALPGHIFNLGHGISPDINPDKVKYLVDLVHSMSEHYHQ